MFLFIDAHLNKNDLITHACGNSWYLQNTRWSRMIHNHQTKHWFVPNAQKIPSFQLGDSIQTYVVPLSSKFTSGDEKNVFSIPPLLWSTVLLLTLCLSASASCQLSCGLSKAKNPPNAPEYYLPTHIPDKTFHNIWALNSVERNFCLSYAKFASLLILRL